MLWEHEVAEAFILAAYPNGTNRYNFVMGENFVRRGDVAMLPLGHSFNGNHLANWLDKLSFGNLGKANSVGNSQAHSIAPLLIIY